MIYQHIYSGKKVSDIAESPQKRTKYTLLSLYNFHENQKHCKKRLTFRV